MPTLHLQIKAGSKKNEFSTSVNGTILVKVKAPATEGKANKELIAFLSETFKIPKSKIEITKGEKSPFKTVEIDIEEKTFLSIYSRKVMF